MDGRQLQAGPLQNSPKFPVWIIEHVWAHRMMDIQEVVEPSSWPDVDSQPLSLEDSWRLRVVSAQVYSIVKSRDIKNFERVMDFLDTTHRLLPRLVPAIKHMKIMFGLKTMVIMWMLKEDRGMINIVSKIGQFFPNRLPQYQDQCSQRKMFLMRKNHLDFKSLAQTLAVNKDRLEEYIKNQMEEQYGERYAQKVEDRLLHYLRELETALPGDTYIDKIMKKQSPVTEEEKLLLEVITSGSTSIATTLRNLLHCDVASCRPVRISQSPVSENREVEISQMTQLRLIGSFTESEERNAALQCQHNVFTDGKEARQDEMEESPLLLEDKSSSDVGEHQLPEKDDEAEKMMEDEGNECCKGASSSPQFCSKHQRWVKNILQGCSDDCSEELPHQINTSSSPVLFQSLSATSSSNDLTPSDLVPSPTEQPPSQTFTHLQTSETANTGSKTSSEPPGTTCDTCQAEAASQPASSQHTPLPRLLSPVVQLVDIASFWRNSRSQQASPNHLTVFIGKQQPSSSSRLASSLCCTSRNKDAMFQESHTNIQPVPVNPDVSTRTSHQLPTQQTFSKLSRKYRHVCNNRRHSHALRKNSSSQQVVKYPGSSPVCCLPLSRGFSVSQLPVQMTSNLLQPYVRLRRLTVQECLRATGGKPSTGQEEPDEFSNRDEMMEMEEETDSSFDVNSLYTSNSSGSDYDDSLNCDPNYRPHIEKKKILQEAQRYKIIHEGF